MHSQCFWKLEFLTGWQVLLDLKRTASTVQPGNFSFGEHFIFEELIGQSKHSEVCCLQAGTLICCVLASRLTHCCAGLACTPQSHRRAVCCKEGHAGLCLPSAQGQVSAALVTGTRQHICYSTYYQAGRSAHCILQIN